MVGKTMDELKVGDFAEFSKTITETDVTLYAGITCDFNPAHLCQPGRGPGRRGRGFGQPPQEAQGLSPAI